MAFTNIINGDPLDAPTAMANWKHVNYGNDLLPVDTNGSGTDDTLKLGSLTYNWLSAYITTTYTPKIEALSSDLTFFTSTSEQMRLTTSGYLGISSNNPQDKIDLGDGTGGYGLTWGGSTGSNQYNSLFTTKGAGRMFIGSAIKGSKASSDVLLYSYTGSIATSAITFNPFGSNAGDTIFYNDASTSRTADATASPSERMRIKSSGKVGIGTSSPDSMLEIETSDNTSYSASTVGGQQSSGSTLTISNLSSNANSFSQLVLETSNQGIVNRIVSGHTSTTDGFLAYVVEDGGAPKEVARMIGDGNGKFGITSTAPQNILDLGVATAGHGIAWGGSTGTNHYNTIWTEYGSGSLFLGCGVKGDMTAGNILYSYTGTIGVSTIEMVTFGSSAGDIIFSGDSASSVTKDNTATPTELMRIDASSGRLGLGVSSPLSYFHVDGSTDGLAQMLRISGSNVNHGMTSIGYGINTSTLFSATIDNDSSFPAGNIWFFLSNSSGNDKPIEMRSYSALPYASDSQFNNGGAYLLNCFKKSGTSKTSLADTDNMFSLQNNDSCEFLVKGNGDVLSRGVIAIADGVSAPSTRADFAQIYVDSSDGDLKVKFGDGTVKTIVVDT